MPKFADDLEKINNHFLRFIKLLFSTFLRKILKYFSIKFLEHILN